MDTISSVKNQYIQLANSLLLAKNRKYHQQFLAEGEHLVQEALTYSKVDYILLSRACVEKYKYLKHHKTLIVDEQVFAKVGETKTPQGICAVCAIEPKPTTKTKLVLCNGVQDPGNLGTIIRTADAVNFDVIVDSSCADVYNPKVVRSSMGSVFHIAIERVNNLSDKMQSLVAKNYSIYGGALNGDAFYTRKKDKLNIGIVVGNEGSGIEKHILNLCTHKFKLPMLGKAESLNVGVAASIMMYDITRSELYE